ncbi:aminotransferase class I/II-fold pyridoxal phosphate-dependent enzyme [Candidatus Latescibacterota bacterium]
MENPYFRVHESVASATTVINSREVINFSSYNYLGFAGDEQVKQAAKAAIDTYGTTVSASRIIAGERPIYQELEDELADFLGADAAVLVVSGYTTNFTSIGHIFHRKDLILYDEFSHNSIVQGAYLSRAKMVPFAHNDMADLERLLTERRGDYRKALIVTEGVYSVDGDIPDLPKLIELKKQHDAFLMIDEAHSLGVIGTSGRGIAEYWDIDAHDIDILMGTLSKSLASCGGYLAGSELFVKYLKYTMPGFMFSVGMTPANTAAALSALRKLKQHPERVAQIQKNAHFFIEYAKGLGLDTGNSHNSGVIPITIGGTIRAMKISNYLFDHGTNVSPLAAPAVPEGEAKLRFFILADHTEDQMRTALETVVEGLKHYE